MFYFLLIIFSDFHRRVQKFQPFGTYAFGSRLSADFGSEMAELQERITSTKNGSITSVQAIYVPADDITDPAPATTFSHLDSTIVLSRALTEIGIYPAVDPLASTSTAWTQK